MFYPGPQFSAGGHDRGRLSGMLAHLMPEFSGRGSESGNLCPTIDYLREESSASVAPIGAVTPRATPGDLEGPGRAARQPDLVLCTSENQLAGRAPRASNATRGSARHASCERRALGWRSELVAC